MDYRSACVAMPAFTFASGFELYIVKYGRLRPGTKFLVVVCMGVSVLQMLSCYLWFYGAAYASEDTYVSGAIANDEDRACIGAVGAEYLTCLFQLSSVVVTLYQSLLARRLAVSVKSMKRVTGLYRSDTIFLKVCVAILVIYAAVIWTAVYTRHCTSGNSYFPWIYHTFHAVFLLLDMVLAMGVQLPVHIMIAELIETSVKVTKRLQSTTMKLKWFYWYQGLLTTTAFIFAVGISVVGGVLSYKTFDWQISIFTLGMYTCYGHRVLRVIALNMNYNLSTGSFTPPPGHVEVSSSSSTSGHGDPESGLPSQSLESMLSIGTPEGGAGEWVRGGKGGGKKKVLRRSSTPEELEIVPPPGEEAPTRMRDPLVSAGSISPMSSMSSMDATASYISIKGMFK